MKYKEMNIKDVKTYLSALGLKYRKDYSIPFDDYLICFKDQFMNDFIGVDLDKDGWCVYSYTEDDGNKIVIHKIFKYYKCAIKHAIKFWRAQKLPNKIIKIL